MVVGVNRFQTDVELKPDLLRVDERVAATQRTNLAESARRRETPRVSPACWRRSKPPPATRTPQLMPLFVEAVEAYATLGEICDALRRVFGEYTPESWL